MKTLIILGFALLTINPVQVYAISTEQRRIIDSGSRYFNLVENIQTTCAVGKLSEEENARFIFNFFVSKGYQPFQAAGILGNISHESGFQPLKMQNVFSDKDEETALRKGWVNQVTPNDGGLVLAEDINLPNAQKDRVGWGIVQFTPPGKFITPTLAAGKDPNNIAVQTEFVWQQLEGETEIPEKKAGDQLKATTSLEEAVLAFQGNRRVGGPYVGYERPQDQSGSVKSRTDAARDALAKFGSGGGGGPSDSGLGCQAGSAVVGDFALPTDRAFYDANVGKFTKTHHDYPAADIGMPEGTPIYSMTNGVVYSANQGGACGIGITIETSDGTRFNYCHGIDGGSIPGAKIGDKVTAGQHIMNSGNTGRSSGPHLHLGIKTPDGANRCPQTLFTSIAAGSPVEVGTLPTSGCTH